MLMKIRVSLLVTTLLALLTGCLSPVQPTPEPTPEPPVATATATVPPPTAEPTAIPTPALSAEELTWWNDAIFYEVFVRSFYDSNDDGIGDINGLIEKLDYLNDGDPATNDDLGVTALWLMPINASPSYHGYDVTDYYTVNPEYGTNEDFQRLMAEAHARGMKVIIDLVLNHTSTQHPWFQSAKDPASPYRDYYLWTDTKPNYQGPWGQNVWHKSGEAFYYAVFWDQMPDLNMENPAVIDEISEVITFWLTEMDADGFRLDAIRHFVEDGAAQENTPDTHALLQEFFQFYKSVKPEAFTVGEAWTLTPLIVDYVGDEVDIAFEFDLAEAFLDTARGPLAVPVKNQLQLVLDSYPAGQYGVFLTNHDQDRVMSQLTNDVVRAKLAAVMMLTSPGVPFIYYGEEIGMTGIKPDEDIRRPMQWHGDDTKAGFSTHLPWRAVAQDYKTVNVAVQEADPDSLLNHYRALLQLRNANSALRTGETIILDADTERLYALLRYDENGAFLILVNVHPKTLTPELYSLSLPEGPFSGAVTAEVVFGSGTASAPVINAAGGFEGYVPLAEIPGQSSVIIRLGE